MWSYDDICVFFKTTKYNKFFHQLREPIQKVDFAKYVILYKTGGIYLDLDVTIINGKTINHLFNINPLIVRWDNSKLPYNAVLGCRDECPIFLDIINQSIHDYNEKVTNPTYKSWIGRFVFQTTGHFMLLRALKKNGITEFENILLIKHKGRSYYGDNPIFLDTNESIWYNPKRINLKNN